MWNLIRCLIAALALVGFVGQTTARAMPMAMTDTAPAATQTAPAMMNCADMPGMSDVTKAAPPQSPIKGPCKGMMADCIGKMGCATVAIPLPASFGVSGSVAYESVTFADINQMREGVTTPRLYHPPRPLA